MGRPELVSVGGDALPYLLAMASATMVGAVLAGRRPRHPVGWLVLAVGVSVIALGVADAYASYGLLARPGSLPGARWVAIYVDSSWVVLSVLPGFVLLLTRTGRLPSPRWRWWARLVVAAAVVARTFRTAPLDPPYRVVEPGPVLVRDGPLAAVGRVGVVGAFVVVLLSLLVAAGSLVVRFRRARGVERQQLRWVSVAAAMAALAAALTPVSWAMLGRRPRRCGAGPRASTSPCCRWPSGRRSCGIGCTTVAAVFQPARRRIQAAVDRPLQPAPLRRRPDDRRLQRPPT
jgi:hypothetical protein